MWKHWLRRTVSIAAPTAALVLIATGLLLKLVMPPGCRGGRGLELWGLSRHDWGDLHYICSLVLGSLLFAYFALPQSASDTTPTSRECDTSLPPPTMKRNRRLRSIALLTIAIGVITAFLWTADRNLVRSATGTHDGTCAGDGHRGKSVETTAAGVVDPSQAP